MPKRPLLINDPSNQIITTTPKRAKASPTVEELSLENTNASSSYLNAVKRMKELRIEEHLAELEAYFNSKEIPIGLLDRLLDYQSYHMDFVIDDSGSMDGNSDVKRKDAMSSQMQERFCNNGRMIGAERYLTRWEEVEDRLHCLVDIFAYIPTQSFNFYFLNPCQGRQNQQIFVYDETVTPEEIKQKAHNKITQMFQIPPNGLTPLCDLMGDIIDKSSNDNKHAIFVFTDGLPDGYNRVQLDDESINPFFELLIDDRKGKERSCPVSFNSCTNEDNDTEWMKSLEKKADYCSECDDYTSKAQEILKAQGKGFPFNRGVWMLLQILGAISPKDLDLIDENLPFSRFSLETISGRKLSIQQYDAYWNHFPLKDKYTDHYELLANPLNIEAYNKPARDFITEDEQTAREEGRYCAAQTSQSVVRYQANLNHNPSLFSIAGNVCSFFVNAAIGQPVNSVNPPPTIRSIYQDCETLCSNLLGTNPR